MHSGQRHPGINRSAASRMLISRPSIWRRYEPLPPNCYRAQWLHRRSPSLELVGLLSEPVSDGPATSDHGRFNAGAATIESACYRAWRLGKHEPLRESCAAKHRHSRNPSIGSQRGQWENGRAAVFGMSAQSPITNRIKCGRTTWSHSPVAPDSSPRWPNRYLHPQSPLS